MAELSLELEEDMRLLPQKMELGKLELLTNSIRLPFEALENQLAAYVRHPNKRLREELRRDIKRYLGRLNANPLFPLSFRLKVLEAFEQHTDLFDVELTAQVLNAYKIGIQLVQKHARKHPEYWPIFVRLVAKALELAEVLLFETLRNHHMQHVIALRQSLDLMRLGLLVAQTEARQATHDVARLRRAIVAHELLRCMDMHAHTDEEQVLIRGELQHFCERVVPVLYAGGEALPDALDLYLITATHEPHHVPYKLMKLPDRAERDIILMPLGNFLEAIKHDIKTARAAADLSEEERAAVMSPQRFREIMHGAVYIPKALQTIQRKHKRELVRGVRVLIDPDIQHAFSTFTDSGLCLSGDMLNPAERRAAWAVRDVSASGMQIEGMIEQLPDVVVGQLIGLRWVDQRLGVNVGFVKWFREEKPGVQQMGIKFLGRELKPTQGSVLQSPALRFPTSMPFLYHPSYPKEVLVPLSGLQAADRLRYRFEEDDLLCHVTLVISAGPNFSYCRIELDDMEAGSSPSSVPLTI